MNRKRRKFLAFLLCFSMILSICPKFSIQASNYCTVTNDGYAVENVVLPQNERIQLTANTSVLGDGEYQWQILAFGSIWVDIAGAKGENLDLSYAMVANLLENDEATVRCKVVNEVGESYSSEVAVVVDYETEKEVVGDAEERVEASVNLSNAGNTSGSVSGSDEDQSEYEEDYYVATDSDGTEKEDIASDSDASKDHYKTASDSDADDEKVDKNDENSNESSGNGSSSNGASGLVAVLYTMRAATAPSTYSIMIEYKFADGSQAANPWTANVATGSDFAQTVNSPSVLGYTPDQSVVNLDYTEISADQTVIVTYHPAEVEFTVVHYQQNLNDDDYTVVEREEKSGYTESAVGGELANDYTGFYALLYDTTTEIAADGSTVVEIYYDRYYYLMTFDLDGGYGTEPIYARYGAPIEVNDPTKAGFVFNGWTNNGTPVESLPSTMPAGNTAYVAQWTAGNTTYDVVFWYENADDEHYSQSGVLENVTAVAGSTVNGSTYKDSNFTGRDSEHFTYSHADENVVIAGDGSTVVNVYFSRNEYTLTFVGDIVVCGKEEHEHTFEDSYTTGGWFNSTTYYIGGCYPTGDADMETGGATSENTICGKSEHIHTSGGWYEDSCYEKGTLITVTAKYDADITDIWENEPIKSIIEDGNAFESSATGDYYSFLEKMPGNNITMTASNDSGNRYTWYYYLEVLPGQDATNLITRMDNNKTYYLYHTSYRDASSLGLTYAEDYYPITGFTQRDNKVPSFNNRVAYLYYVRNSYDLTFSNHGTTVAGKGGTYLYQADISGTYFVPDYPEDLEPNAYVFDDWYTSPFFGDTKFKFTSQDEAGNTIKATMPANDLTLYARWVPKNHNVNIYMTVNEEGTLENQVANTQVVPHRTLAIDPYPEAVPKHPSGAAYIFVGWFYMDGDTEKAFDFSMPVIQDLDLYAKWSSNVLMEYTIKYAVVDSESGNTTYIAEETTGSALAGTTKTFEAKAGTELFEGYQSGYFPTTNSHSLTIDIEEPTKNVYTFIYVPKDELPYTVMYLEYDGDYEYDGTETVLHEQKEAKTRDAVITETFEPIVGYMPDAYQKRLVLSADETENVIIFWYVKDDTHAPVQIIHYIQNAEGEGYREYQSTTDMNGVIGNVYSTDVLDIDGYTYDHATANDEAVEASEGTVRGTVTASGLLLELYYNRNLYPYEFQFLEQGTDKVLADSVIGEERYGAQVTQNAKQIAGYECVGENAQAITIQMEDGDIAEKNVRIFYYKENEVTIQYVSVTPEWGTVVPESETVKVISGTAQGSTPTAKEGYRFVGWFTDEECTIAVDSTWVDAGNNYHITPGKTETYGTDQGTPGYEIATYYAKFERDVINLTIKKSGAETIDVDQTFIFNVVGTSDATNHISMKVTVVGNGSATIMGLPVGSYKISEDESWSWRYTAADVTVELDEDEEVTVQNTRSVTEWLDYNFNVANKFKTMASVTE